MHQGSDGIAASPEWDRRPSGARLNEECLGDDGAPYQDRSNYEEDVFRATIGTQLQNIVSIRRKVSVSTGVDPLDQGPRAELTPPPRSQHADAPCQAPPTPQKERE